MGYSHVGVVEYAAALLFVAVVSTPLVRRLVAAPLGRVVETWSGARGVLAVVWPLLVAVAVAKARVRVLARHYIAE